MSRLVYEQEGKRVEITLEDAPVTFGRGDEADHKLPTRKASRIHAQVLPRDGGWWVEDLGSSNGTGVNGRRISGARQLSAGDVVNIGDFELRFEQRPEATPPHEEASAHITYDPGKGKAAVETPIRDHVTIGRRAHNDLQIDNKAVSGAHCEVVRSDGEYVLRDLDSSNGTFVKKERIDSHVLRDGDVVMLGGKVKLTFRDLSSSRAAPPETPKAPAAEAAAPYAGTSASDFGHFEKVQEATRRAIRIHPVPVAVGLVLGGLLAIGGWMLGGVTAELREANTETETEREPEPVLADAAQSFEGPVDERGDPEGWDAGFESAGQTELEIARDPEDPWDGRYSLRIHNRNPEIPGTFVLQAVEARELELGGAFETSLHLKGESAGRVAVALCVVDEQDGRVTTVAAGTFGGVKSSRWSRVRMKGVPQTSLPQKGKLRLMISAGFSRLWLDRLEIRRTRADRKPSPLADIGVPGLAVALDDRNAGEVVVTGDAGAGVRMEPVLLDYRDRRVSESGLWSVTEADSEALDYTAMMPSLSATADVMLTAEERENRYFDDRGLRLGWTSGDSASSLAVDITLPFPDDAELAVADRRGLPLVVDRDALHAYPYSTVTEIMVNQSDLAVSFPDGAVLWLDFSTPGVVVATVRAPREGARKGFSLVVNPRPVMFARLYQRVLDEAERLVRADHYSAALARLEFLTSPSRPDAGLPVIELARERMREIADYRASFEDDITEAWGRAADERSTENVRAARELVRRYLREFPGGDNTDLVDRLERLAEWQAELEIRERTPEEMETAISEATALIEAARSDYASRDILMALVRLESVMRDYAHTPQVHEARSLHTEYTREMNDPAMRDAFIDEVLKAIDEDLRYEDYDRAREKCLELFRRFPDTERNRDIMKRLRAADAASAD